MSSRPRGRGRGYMGRGSFNRSSHYHGEERKNSWGGGGGKGGSFRGSNSHNSEYRHSRFKEEASQGRDYHMSRGGGNHREGRGEHHHSHGRDEFHSGGRRGPRSPPPHRPSPSPHRRSDADHILAKLKPADQEALTKALVDTVLLKTGRDGLSRRDERDSRPRQEQSRDYGDRQTSSRYMGREPHRGGRGRGRGRGSRYEEGGPHTRLSMPEPSSRRKYEDDYSGPPHKRARLSHNDSGGRSDFYEGNNRRKSFDDRRDRRQMYELNCPHCPGHVSITMEDYKYHLSSKMHNNNMARLSRRHSQLLLRMRKEQRTEQKNKENEYLEKHPDHAEISTTKFCGICKLNFRCLGGDVKANLVEHCKSRLHKMQQNFLFPRCTVCSQNSENPNRRFKSRMVYEHHVASITHMKKKNEHMDSLPEELATEEGDEEINLDGFMTVDSVGGDEMPGEEILDEETNEEEKEEEDDKEGEKIDVEGERAGSFEAVGLHYVKPIRVHFCTLCKQNIQGGGTKRHCGTPSHRNKYFQEMERKKEKESDESKETKEEKEDSATKVKAEGEEVTEKVKDDEDDSEKDYEDYNDKYNRYNTEREDEEDFAFIQDGKEGALDEEDVGEEEEMGATDEQWDELEENINQGEEMQKDSEDMEADHNENEQKEPIESEEERECRNSSPPPELSSKEDELEE